MAEDGREGKVRMNSTERMTEQGVRDLNAFGKKKPRVSDTQLPEPEARTIPAAGRAPDKPSSPVPVPSMGTSEQ
jgi:hypothetical protein